MGEQHVRSIESVPGPAPALALLDSVTAGVVGLISATALVLLRDTVTTIPVFGIFLAALVAHYLMKTKAAVAVVVLGSGLVGLLLFKR